MSDNISVVREGNQVRVVTVAEQEETYDLDNLHYQIAEYKRYEQMYLQKAAEHRAKWLRLQQILYEALGEELQSAQGGDGDEPQGE
jgi:hypothetical protein